MFLRPILLLFSSQALPRHCLCLEISIFWLAIHNGCVGGGSPFQMSPFIPPELPAFTSTRDCVKKRGRLAFSDCEDISLLWEAP